MHHPRAGDRESLTGSYTLGLILLAIVATICLIVLAYIDRALAADNPARTRAIRNRRHVPLRTGRLCHQSY